jgi:anti-anti-sigma factor
MAEYRAGPATPGRRTLAVSGEVDIAVVEEFLAEADRCLDDGADRCEIDLGAVTFIDSSGLGALVRLRKIAHDRGKTVLLTNVPASVNRLLEVTGLSEAFAAPGD